MEWYRHSSGLVAPRNADKVIAPARPVRFPWPDDFPQIEHEWRPALFDAFSVTQHITAHSFTQGSPFTIQLGSNATAGGIYVLGIGHYPQAVTGVTDGDPGSAWTRIVLDDHGGTDYTELWWRPVTAGNKPTVSVAWAAGNQNFIDMYLAELAGLNTTSPVDGIGNDHNDNSSPASAVTGVSTAGGIGIVFAWNPTNQTFSAHSGFTEIDHLDVAAIVGPLSGWLGYQTAVVGALSTFTGTIDLSGNDYWGCVVCVLKQAGSTIAGRRTLHETGTRIGSRGL